MKKYLKEFILRGLMFSGFGPVILAIIYFIVAKAVPDTVFSGEEILCGTISVYLLAFVHAGASVFNQIEEWGINKSVACHFGALYVAYSVCYLINSWIPFDIKVFAAFTGIFIAVYAVVWTIVYICVRRSGRRLNKLLTEKE